MFYIYILPNEVRTASTTRCVEVSLPSLILLGGGHRSLITERDTTEILQLR